jgi:hypothetical protein
MCPTVHVKAVVNRPFRELLMQNFSHEVLLQKPIMFDSLPTGMHRDKFGLPVNTHLINFLKGGDTIVITVSNLLSGYSFQASTLWDAIAFEEFAKKRLSKICDHAEQYVDGSSADRMLVEDV